MLEIAPNTFIVKNKIVGMKIVSKENKHWVVFHLGQDEKNKIEVFSADHPTVDAAKAFLNACASSL